MNPFSNSPTPDIPCDYHGHPIHSGINIRGNGQYAVVTGGGIGIMHYLIPMVLHIVLFPAWIVLLVVCLGPAMIGMAIFGGGTPVPEVLAIIGILVWLWLSIRWTRKIVRSFSHRTKYNYVDGYRGPLRRRGYPLRRV